VAISADGQGWFLLNASPDIRAQIENFPPLRPAGSTARNSPIEAVLLTNADLDHTLGLLLLREGEKLRVHATPEVRGALAEGVGFETVLGSFCGVEWIVPAAKADDKEANPHPYPRPSDGRGRSGSSVEAGFGPRSLLRRDGAASGLSYEAIPLPGKPPRFMKSRMTADVGNVTGYRITDDKTGGRLLFLPDVSGLSENLLRWLPECDALLFDGTFWSENEMREQGVGTLAAADMGHVPISGTTGSLKTLAKLQLQHKIYTHINNTNPILIEDSAERAAVEAAGCIVGRDGMEFEI
jgi:pyrroloquinoline quinone biosynthesis protein B